MRKAPRNDLIWRDVIIRGHTLKRAGHNYGIAGTTVASIISHMAVKKGILEYEYRFRGVRHLRELVNRHHLYETVTDFAIWD